jgi:flagellar export protein FliJ
MAAFALQPALDLAERRAEAKSRTVKVAYVGWLNARTHLVRLEQRRHLYTGELNHKLQQGCSAAMAQAAAEALRQWQTSKQSATRDLENARHLWQLALDAWQIEKKRVEALQVLARRHALEQRKLEEKRESRLHDELSARSAFAHGSSGQDQAVYHYPQEAA